MAIAEVSLMRVLALISDQLDLHPLILLLIVCCSEHLVRTHFFQPVSQYSAYSLLCSIL